MQRDEPGQGPTRAGAPMGAEPDRSGDPIDTGTLGGESPARRFGRGSLAIAALFIVVAIALFVWWLVALAD